MKLQLVFIIVSLLVFSCSQSNILITDRNDIENNFIVMDTIHHTSSKDQGISISTSFPMPNMDLNGSGIGVQTYAIDARWRNINVGELELALAYYQSDFNVTKNWYHHNRGPNSYIEYYGAYSFPFFKWQHQKLTKTNTSYQDRVKSYQTRFLSPIHKSLNLRLGINNVINQEIISASVQEAWLLEMLSGKYTSEEILDVNLDGYWQNWVLHHSSQTMRLGIGFKHIQYMFYQGKDQNLCKIKGKKNVYSQFYIDALFLVNSKVNDNIISIRKFNDPYDHYDDEHLEESVNFEPYLKKQSVGVCLGYYKELYINNSNSMVTIKSEVGIRPGYYYDFKSSRYVSLGLGFGGGMGFKQKRKWKNKF